MTGSASQRGFTLVEVVVALSILALVMLATVTALRTFGNTRSSLDQLITRVDDVRAVSGWLRASFESAVPGRRGSRLGMGAGASASGNAIFQGTADSIQWQAPVLFGEAYGGILLLRLAKERDRLVLRWQEPIASDDEPEWVGTESRVLLDELQALEVSYRPGFGADWQTDWDEPGSPAALRLGIRAGDRYWPELIMQVQQ
jgi:general secretion pathway protein J